jgi:hypothetical protein
MSSTASILARLARLEKALHLEDFGDDGSLEQVLKQLSIIASRRREAPGWRPCGVSLAVLVEKARAAARH